MRYSAFARSIAAVSLAWAAPLAAQQPVQPIQAPAVPQAAVAQGPQHPVPPVKGRAATVPLNVDPFRFRSPAPVTPAARVAAPGATRPGPTLAEHLAATAAPQPHGDPLPPLPPDENPVQVPVPQPAPAPALRAPQAPTLTQMLNAPGPKPAAATARCKDGSYVTTASPSSADCTAHAGVAVFYVSPASATGGPQ